MRTLTDEQRIDIVLYRVKVNHGIAHAHHLVEEETVVVPVVAIDVEGVLGPQFIEH